MRNDAAAAPTLPFIGAWGVTFIRAGPLAGNSTFCIISHLEYRSSPHKFKFLVLINRRGLIPCVYCNLAKKLFKLRRGCGVPASLKAT